jgi:spoIIIJ-associated protein
MSLFKKIFGGGSSKSGTQDILEDVVSNVIKHSGLDLSYDVKVSKDSKDMLFDFYGDDEHLITDRDGAFLNAMQLFLKRVNQNKTEEKLLNVIVDSGTFREDQDQSLVDLAEKLKSVCLKKKKPVYFRAFPPRERKIIHQYLSDDDSVKSKSVGDGLFKKIKIFPANYKPSKRRPSDENGNSHSSDRGNRNSHNNTRNAGNNQSSEQDSNSLS